MPRGFYSEDRLICHRSIEGIFRQSSVNFGFCRRHFLSLWGKGQLGVHRF